MGTHPIFESDFDCLTDLQVKMVSIYAVKIVKVSGMVPWPITTTKIPNWLSTVNQ